MNKLFPISLSLAIVVSCSSGDKLSKMITPVNFSQVNIEDSFWTPRIEKHKSVTMNVCIDQIENQTGRMRNFENAALKVRYDNGEKDVDTSKFVHSGIFFDDSDVYKALEGMAYSLQNVPDPELEAKCDEWIDKFAAAQASDGYLNTYYTLTGNTRWNDMNMHEMYCAGHMIEAAVAYYRVTGKRKLVDVCCRYADCMMEVFGPGKRDWVPGHEEIELALVKLFEVTGERKYLEFANWLLDERGHNNFMRNVAAGEYEANPDYFQDDVPVADISEIAGHAVRAMYLYCGMSDVAAYTGNKEYIDAMTRVWEDVVYRNMYITGGIGSSRHNEGFTVDFDLPNKEAYCETCASVGMVLWNWRMNQFTGDSKYMDVLERSMYNGALAGISLDGDRFFYVNPLESDGNHHRQAWYGCACCPSQVCRFLPSLGNYIYGVSDDAIWVNLFIGGDASMKVGSKKVSLTQSTSYPWNGDVTIKIATSGKLDRAIRVRIPVWCKSSTLAVNGEQVEPVMDKGYAVLDRVWKDGDVITLSMDMPVEVVAADPRVKADAGMRAIMRGPLVYCIEGVDNPDTYADAALSDSTILETEFKDDLLCGVQTITAKTGDQILNYIPYYSWDNREAGPMRVWVPFN